MSSPCDCVHCVMTAANLQVCAVLVTVNLRTLQCSVAWPRDKLATDETKLALCKWVTQTLDSAPTKAPIGATYDFNVKDFEGNIKRVARNRYKVCYHAKAVDEDPT